MPVTRLRKYLDGHNIRYIAISHSTAYTAQGVAASSHISGKTIAKTVLVKLDDVMTMLVLPASERIDLSHLRDLTHARDVELAHEDDFKSMFPDCEIGAFPPFGNLYGMDVIVSKSLTRDPEIAFNAGSHRELIRMAYSDFAKLVKPKVMDFSVLAV